MSHGVRGRSGRAAIDGALAEEVADALRALGSPSRLRILGRMREGPCPVGELARAAELSPSAASHQLRLLRHLGWVTRARSGRHILYALHDPHVADLIDQAISHLEHVRLARSEARGRAGAREPTHGALTPRPSRARRGAPASRGATPSPRGEASWPP